MSYNRRKHEDIVFFDENTSVTSSKNAFAKRLKHGKKGEEDLLTVLKRDLAKRGLKNIKIWDGVTYQRDVMGWPPCNKVDTLVGDIVISREKSNNTRDVIMRLDSKLSVNDDNATVSFHGGATECFNSFEETFYATKKNNKWYVVWAQDLAMLITDGVSIKTGERWWSRETISNYLVPLEDALDIFYKRIDISKKCDLMEATRTKYHPFKAKTLKEIEEEQKKKYAPTKPAVSVSSSNTPKPSKATPSKTIIVKCGCNSKGYYGTVPELKLLEAENRKETTIFELDYCPNDNEPGRPPAKLNFEDIRDNWRTLLKGNNRYIKSKDIMKYLDKG